MHCHSARAERKGRETIGPVTHPSSTDCGQAKSIRARPNRRRVVDREDSLGLRHPTIRGSGALARCLVPIGRRWVVHV